MTIAVNHSSALVTLIAIFWPNFSLSSLSEQKRWASTKEELCFHEVRGQSDFAVVLSQIKLALGTK